MKLNQPVSSRRQAKPSPASHRPDGTWNAGSSGDALGVANNVFGGINQAGGI